MTTYGIDFGTTNCVLAQWSGDHVTVESIDEPPGDWAQLGFDRVLPSVMTAPPASPAFGWAAKRHRGPKLEAVKRLFATEEFVRVGDECVRVEEVAANLFRHIRRTSGAGLDKAVVTVPANSLGRARYRTRQCAGIGGISVSALINEPTAAAMAYARTAGRDETILVFDWGGGTLDVTVLEAVEGVFIERASKGVGRLGGIDVDQALADAIRRDVPASASWSPDQQNQFLADIEYVKVRLSTDPWVPMTFPDGQTAKVTQETLNRAVAPLLERAREPIERCLADLGMTAGDVDRLLMVGGTSKLPSARAMVSETVGREPEVGVDPMTAVAEGAAVAGAILTGELDLDFFVGSEHALGTVTHDRLDRPHFSVLIPRNHQLPAKATDRYLPVVDGQDTVLVRVIEGDPDRSIDHPENIELQQWEIGVDPTVPRGDAAFDITYAYDVEGILHIDVTDAASGRVMLHEDVSYVGPDKAELVAIAGRVRAATPPPATASSTPLDPEAAGLVERVTSKIVPFVDDAERARLEALVRAVENDPTAASREALRTELRSYSYLL